MEFAFRLGILFYFTEVYASNQTSPGPVVILSSATFYTKHNFTNTSNDTQISYLLPITFKTLEFNCTANYPTVWKFGTPPYIDTRLKDINITKTRFVKNFTNRSTYIFNSTLRMHFKHTTSIPQFFCRRARNNEFGSKYVTAVNSNMTDDFHHQISIVRNHLSDSVSTEGRAGNNTDCNITLNIDLRNQTFSCGTVNGTVNVTVKTRPQIIHCNNPDECSSIFVKDDHCGNKTFSKQCDSDKCPNHHLYTSNSPGVIICLDSTNTTNVYNSIARRYLLTQTPKEMHLHLGRDNDFEDETIYITSDRDKSSIFVDQWILFICNGTGAYYTHGFQWAINDSYGNMHFLGNGRETYLQEMQIYNVTKSILQKEDYGSPVQIICFGPRWNLDKWVNATMTIKIKKFSKPSISLNENETYSDCGTKSLESKNVTHRFTCIAKGYPIPSFNWSLEADGRKSYLSKIALRNKTEGFHSINTVNISDKVVQTTLTVHFKLSDKHTVTCIAMNYKGNDRTNFTCPAELNSSPSISIPMISALAVVSVALVIISAGAFYLIRRQRRKLQLLSEEEIAEFEKGNPNSDNALMLLPYNMEYEIPREQILIENTVLGEGQFGMVMLGKLMKTGALVPQQVAIKTYKKTADVGFLKALLSEIKIMSQVGKHPYLVNLVGANTKNIRKREVLVLIEFCHNGNLLKFLRMSRGTFLDYFSLSGNGDAKQRQIRMMQSGLTEQEMEMRFTTTQNLLLWSYECANAMDYLSNQRVIHGDLAARNILLTETFHVKVGDFGLSKQLFEYSIYVQNLNCPLPLKWMAIESLQDLEFSVQSDIWAYGITLWEIFSLGQSPYPGIPQWNFQSYTLLQNGYRMDKPEFANRNIYKMMLACWDGNPHARPLFTKLKDFFFRELSLTQGSSSIPISP